MTPKIALLVPADLWFCPFVNIYTTLFDEWSIPYIIIYWHRQHDRPADNIENVSIYHGCVGKNKISKFIEYYRFAKFIKKELIRIDYTGVIVFSSQIGIFCSSFLKKHYKGRYIFDFRDLSIEQSKIFYRAFTKLLKNSFANVISSPGFKECLPTEFQYLISHNIIKQEAILGLEKKALSIPTDVIRVLTIGGIRIDSNPEIIQSLGNKAGIQLDFIGKGRGSLILKEIVDKHNFKNVSFEGFYDKKDEPSIIKKATFLNIFYPDLLSHKTAMSNRFYNSLIYRRPMIVTKGQIQGDYCEKYNVGIAIENADDLDKKLRDWLDKTDLEEYQNNCIRLLTAILEDDCKFKSMVYEFAMN